MPSAKLPSSAVVACASCLGSPALPAHNVTVEPATGAAPGLNLPVDANGSVRRAACQAQQSKDPERQGAPRRPLLLVSLHVIPSRDAFEGDLTEPGYRKVILHAMPHVSPSSKRLVLRRQAAAMRTGHHLRFRSSSKVTDSLKGDRFGIALRRRRRAVLAGRKDIDRAPALGPRSGQRRHHAQAAKLPLLAQPSPSPIL